MYAAIFNLSLPLLFLLLIATDTIFLYNRFHLFFNKQKSKNLSRIQFFGWNKSSKLLQT